jgi:hypothetical protein
MTIDFLKPQRFEKTLRFFFLCIFLSGFCTCQKDDQTVLKPTIALKTGNDYIKSGDQISTGGKVKIGVVSFGNGEKITYLSIKRTISDRTITELDKGIYEDKLDTSFTFSKGEADKEIWKIFIQTSNRDTVSISFYVTRKQGMAFSEIIYFPSIILSYQNNHQNDHFLDVETGKTFDENSVAGHEGEIDLISYFYLTSGKNSPTLSCPGYTTSSGYYSQILNWSARTSIVYDYYTSDNGLISPAQFDAVTNDSLLVNGFKPEKISGVCKFTYKDRVIPFKTQAGKYGLIKVISADELETGKIQMAVKIQK